MTYVYIKPKVKKKYDTAAMIRATNEAYTGWLSEHCLIGSTFERGGCIFIEGDFSGGGNE